MLGGLNNLYRMSLLLTADTRFHHWSCSGGGRLLRFSGTVNKFGQSLNRGVGLAFGIVGAAAVQAAAGFDRANAILGQIVGRIAFSHLPMRLSDWRGDHLHARLPRLSSNWLSWAFALMRSTRYWEEVPSLPQSLAPS